MATSSSRWYQTLPPCQKSVLVYRQHLALSSCRSVECKAEQQCTELGITLDQSPDRNNQTTRGEDGKSFYAPCLLPGQVLWLHIPGEEERILLGREALMLQGFPVCRVPKPGGQRSSEEVTEHFLHDLAGNAMTFHVLLAVVQSAMAALTWREGKTEHITSAKEELDSAYALFSQLPK